MAILSDFFLVITLIISTTPGTLCGKIRTHPIKHSLVNILLLSHCLIAVQPYYVLMLSYKKNIESHTSCSRLVYSPSVCSLMIIISTLLCLTHTKKRNTIKRPQVIIIYSRYCNCYQKFVSYWIYLVTKIY